MIGTARRRLALTTALAVFLVWAAATWPAANVHGQEKGDGPKGPPPAEPVPATITLVQPVPSVPPVKGPDQALPNGPGFPTPPPVPGSGFGGPGPAVMLPGGVSSGSAVLMTIPMQPPQRFAFTIDPKTPLKDLLPVSPKARFGGPFLGDDLAQVPEVQFGVPVEKNPEAMKNTAHQIAKINYLNKKKTDGFLDALRDERTDLRGLPFAMGDACRTQGERSRQFTAAVQTVRAFMQQQGGNADGFWAQYLQNCAQCDANVPKPDKALREHANLARVAALMQILAPESPSMRLGLVKYLSAMSRPEATRALARLAVYSAEDEVRQAAIDALKVRRERDYTDVLVQGMRYPWPAIAKRAADAIVKLERNDLIPQLVDMLDEPDPRAPVLTKVDKKEVPVVREMVRINHHRNCLMCHSPGNTGTVSGETLTVAVPTPDQPLMPPQGGYSQGGSPDLLVRIDVTYLRQDFSVFQPVADAAPWPEMQRFDFLVRSRELTDEEATAYRAKLDKREKGRITPYQRAAVTALREMTGKDTGPTSEAWRTLLELK